ncbi:hypothetical protein Q1695_014893 [Nippostrongylus brasiliensis]|nr:hypothetical protein Q1695_014893 [Nippostrongylus brasiliensis]
MDFKSSSQNPRERLRQGKEESSSFSAAALAAVNGADEIPSQPPNKKKRCGKIEDFISSDGAKNDVALQQSKTIYGGMERIFVINRSGFLIHLHTTSAMTSAPAYARGLFRSSNYFEIRCTLRSLNDSRKSIKCAE